MKVTISDDGQTVVFRPAPLEIPLAFKGKLEVPVRLIVSAAAVARAEVPYGPLLRAPGAHVPGLLRFGSYGRKPNRQFWAVFRQDPVLVVDVDDWDYARLVVGVADPARTVGFIQMAMT